MALELLPDGTFKKLTKVQTDALDRYYKRENKKDVSTEAFTSLIGGLPLIIGVGIASTAYIFRDTIKERIEEEGIGAGLSLAKLITRFTRGEQNRTEPRAPQFRPSQLDPEVMVEVPRCLRYEQDYVDKAVIAKGIPLVGTPLQALSQLHTIESMKIEGCSKPDIIPQSQWDQA